MEYSGEQREPKNLAMRWSAGTKNDLYMARWKKNGKCMCLNQERDWWLFPLQIMESAV